LDYSIIGIDEEQLGKIEPRIFPIEYSEQPQAKFGDRICIIQHASGRRKQFSNNSIVDVQYPFVHYDVDTEDGSSGSPVLRNVWKLQLIAIHSSGNETELVNKGILFSAIIDDLHDRCNFTNLGGKFKYNTKKLQVRSLQVAQFDMQDTM
jgi:V8-like Glu-specific endopeptidase